jgi:hypothetical protein
MLTESEIPSHIHDLADACVRYVDQSLGIQLDFTPDTLPILDHYIENIPEEEDERAAEIVELLTPCIGAYFGEMIRRTTGSARWHDGGEDFSRYRLEFESFYLYFNPMGVALEALEREDYLNWSSHFGMLDQHKAAVSEVLDQAGSVQEDDYYKLTVRWEVLQLIMDALATLTQRDKTRPQRFGPDVYQAMIDSTPPKSQPN